MKARATNSRTAQKRRAAGSIREAGAADGLVCDKCGHHNRAGASSCSECNGKRWAPKWVREVRRINRSFAVQVTDAHPAAEEPGGKRLTLYKWWPGGKATFNVPTLAQWERVKSIVGAELASFLNWPTVAGR